MVAYPCADLYEEHDRPAKLELTPTISRKSESYHSKSLTFRHIDLRDGVLAEHLEIILELRRRRSLAIVA
jgi:hypothetical protein